MLAHLSQEVRTQPLYVEKVEHRSRSVMARRIVGRPGEPGGARTVSDLQSHRRFPMSQRLELAEPAGDHRPERAVARNPQEAVSLAQLAVLVAAADHECLRQPLSSQRERHDTERVIDVYEQ